MSDTQKKLLAAILAATSEMPVLHKGNFNPHAKYNYVSIDDYYSKVVPIMLKYGLSMNLSETGPAFMLTDKTMLFNFSITLSHADGGSIVSTMSVPHNMQGAQTSGSAQSYAVKCFLRSTFGLVTGEFDADAFAPEEQTPVAGALPTTTSPPPGEFAPPPGGGDSGDIPRESREPVTKEEAATIVIQEVDGLPVLQAPDGPGYPWALAHDIFEDRLPYIHDNKKVTEFWRMNIAVMDAMKIAEPSMHASIKTMFENQRRQNIQHQGGK